MKRITILILLGFFAFNIQAQKSEIKKIRKQYYSVSEQIKNKSLYINEIVINKNGKEKDNWPAVGNYYNKMTFYYDTPPAHWDGEAKKSLIKIVSEQVYAARNLRYEYLFKNGKLIFCYIKQKDLSEHRYYFSKGKLIKYLEKLESDLAEFNKEYYKDILDNAKRLQKLYISISNEEY